MTKLTARFDVDLVGELLVAWPEEEEIVFKQVIDGFEVEIQFDKEWAASRKIPEEQNTRYSFSKAKVHVSREEDETPPSIRAEENGSRDYLEARIYFDERRMEYGEVAHKVTNRVIRYFKYVMKTPKLFEISRKHDCFRNATWTDSSGNDYRHGGTQFGSLRISAKEGRLGRQRLTPELKESFLEAIEEPIVPSLSEEILSDAQTAFFADNIRRAVLELAIACEIFVKRKYFLDETPAGAAFDYLEDKSLVRVRVLDLIDRIALEAFGRSYRVEQNVNYQNIDRLFRCRNKVVHRGELAYRDDSAKRIEVDSTIVSGWWDSVLALIDWIEDL